MTETMKTWNEETKDDESKDLKFYQVKVHFSSPVRVLTDGMQSFESTYLMTDELIRDLMDAVLEGADNWTFYAKRYFAGGWKDVFETIILANVSCIEWPVKLEIEDL